MWPVREYLASIERHAPRPWLRPVRDYFNAGLGPEKLAVHVGGRVLAVHRVSETEAIVATERRLLTSICACSLSRGVTRWCQKTHPMMVFTRTALP